VIGLVPVGYADGYPHALGRVAAQGAPVEVAIVTGDRTAVAPLVGSVSMDQITVDLTDVVAGGADVAIGCRVELISADRGAPNHVARLAAFASTNPYELLCRMNPRIRRAYRDDVPVVHTVARDATSDKSSPPKVQLPL
jgi:alanine racemase